jgi:hypothetical protein
MTNKTTFQVGDKVQLLVTSPPCFGVIEKVAPKGVGRFWDYYKVRLSTGELSGYLYERELILQK